MPDTVGQNATSPYVGRLDGVNHVMTGPSNVNKPVVVETELAEKIFAECDEPKPTGARHCTEVSLTNTPVAQAVAPIATVADRSTGPKFIPQTVTVAAPSSGAFGCRSDVMAGASYDTAEMNVWADEATVSDTERAVRAPAGAEQVAAVPELQLTVTQLVKPTLTVAVKSAMPKFVPTTLSVAAPVVGMLGRWLRVPTGASYEKRVPAVPTCSEMLRVAYNCRPTPVGEAHRTEVNVVQAVLAQIVSPILAVAVASNVPKLAPVSVRDMPALAAPLLRTTVVIWGAPYVYARRRVPDCPAWKTTTLRAWPAPGEVTHTIAELEVHEVVLHADRPIMPVADMSAAPKLVPKTVTESPPTSGATSEARALVNTGAS